jgi:CHASE3 domain sensor protein/CheY-like chemotaxis protein
MTVQARLWFGYSISLLFFCILAVQEYHLLKKVQLSEQWVTHTHQVLEVIDELISELKDAETGQRGYLLTSKEVYLEPYNSALSNIPVSLQRLKTLTQDNPQQQQKITQVRPLINKKLEELGETVQLHRAGSTDAALALVLTNKGQQFMDDIRILIKEMRTVENILLEARKQELNQVYSISKWIVFAGSLLMIFITGLIAYLTSKNINKEYRQLKSTEKALSNTNKELNFQNNEKDKRAVELVIVYEKLAFESKEKALFEHQLQLQRTQRLESLGVLSGGIAHDFNNILAIIIGNCELTKMNLETAARNIPKILAAAERGAGLCRQMMAYAGNTPLTMTNVDMVVQVDDAIFMLKEALSQNAVIKTEVSGDISMIKGDVNQLNQVVMNLIINASEAIGTEQGEVDVLLTRYRVIAGKTFKDYRDQVIPAGEYVCLEVTDNGGGMDEETKEKIFEPFYTTKFTGRGLGMSAVLGIIKSHAGALQLFSQLGQGTTFKIYLPALSNEHNVSEKESSSAHSVSWKGSGTLLLVEDDENIRPLAKEFLEILGYTVLEAVNGKEALKMYKNNSAEINLVFTDMGMPVMDGYELFEKLKKIKPELPIVVSSGFGDTEISTKLGQDNLAGFVSKPYSLDKLREVMKGVLP